MYYRLYSLECADGVYIGVKVADTEKDTSDIDKKAMLRYFLRMHEREGTYYNIYRLILIHGFKGFTIKYDSKIFTNKDECYDKMREIQLKVPKLINDFVISNKKVVCECGHNVREEYLDMHKQKYCRLNDLNKISESSIFG